MKSAKKQSRGRSLAGRILKPARPPTSVTITAVRRAVREQMQEKGLASR